MVARVYMAVILMMATWAVPFSAPGVASAGVSEECPKAVQVGLRGSRDDLTDISDSDATLDATFVAIQKQIPDAQFAAIHYPAIPGGYGGVGYMDEYDKSVAVGVEAARTYEKALRKKCPDTWIVRVGFSQGSSVTSRLGMEYSYRTLTINFGDPDFNGQQPEVNMGSSTDPNMTGAYRYAKAQYVSGVGVVMPPARVIPAEQVPHVRSVCIGANASDPIKYGGDPACNYAPVNLMACVMAGKQNCAHLLYPGYWTDRAAEWAVSRID